MDNTKIIDMKAIKREEFKKKVVSKACKVKDFTVQHWSEILLISVPVIKLGTVAVKAIGKRSNLNKEQDLKENYCYDRSLGHYWELRRKLSNQEWVEIYKRKKNGERLGDILQELKVLK